MEFKPSKGHVIALGSLFLIFLVSCGPREKHEATFVCKKCEASGKSDIYLELKENGHGVWKNVDEEVSFRWEVDDNELRLHLKLGGVIIGKMKRRKIEISLPGTGPLTFKKVRIKKRKIDFLQND